MPTLLQRLAWSALCAVTSLAMAAPLPPAARAEVESVLNELKASGCQFNRNGTWYSGTDAQAHLTQKLTYLENKRLIQSAEEFIALGASASSASGKAYQVKCGNASAVESKLWLSEKLKMLRGKPPKV